jgi:hypothetical protein
VFVFVALGIQHAMRMRHIVICGPHGCTVFFHITSQKARFSKKEKVIDNKLCFDFLYKFVCFDFLYTFLCFDFLYKFVCFDFLYKFVCFDFLYKFVF